MFRPGFLRWILLVIPAALLVLPPPVHACTCVTPRPLIAIGVADLVFSGTVTRVVDPREGERYQSGGDPIAYTFRIDTLWKGSFQDTVVVYSAREGATCGFVFHPGEEYLVLATDRRGALWTGLCTGTKPLESATRELDVLAGLPVTGPANRVDAALADGLIEKTGSASESTRVEAIGALGAIGKMPDRVIPALVKIARKAGERERAQAVRAVAQFDDPRARRAVADGLSDTSPSVRGCVVLALGWLDEDEDFALPLYLKALGDPDAKVRSMSCLFISSLRSKGDVVIPRLVAALEDEDPGVRTGAAGSLASYGDQAQAAIPDLLEALADTSARLRSNALGAINAVSEDDSLVAGLLVRATHDSDAGVREDALSSLSGSRFGFTAIADQAQLDALGDQSWKIRQRAADYFGNCCHGRHPRPFLGSEELFRGLMRASRDTSGAVREAAIRALGVVDHPEAALPRLREALRDPNSEVRSASLLVIRRMKPPPRDLLPDVRPLLEDPAEEVRWQAKMAVQALETPTAPHR